MPAVTASYLVEDGRKASLLSGGKGRALQELVIQVPANRRSLSNSSEPSNDLPWSSRLITLLLSELHVSDEFYDLVDSAEQPGPQEYRQLIVIALLLRHSWFREDERGTAHFTHASFVRIHVLSGL